MPQSQVLHGKGPLRPKSRDQGAEYGEKHDGEPIAAVGLTASLPARTEFVGGTGGGGVVRDDEIAMGRGPEETVKRSLTRVHMPLECGSRTAGAVEIG